MRGKTRVERGFPLFWELHLKSFKILTTLNRGRWIFPSFAVALKFMTSDFNGVLFVVEIHQLEQKTLILKHNETSAPWGLEQINLTIFKESHLFTTVCASSRNKLKLSQIDSPWKSTPSSDCVPKPTLKNKQRLLHLFLAFPPLRLMLFALATRS